MENLTHGGRIVDLVLVVMAAELVLMFAYRRRTGKGLEPVAVVLMLLPGVFLLLALRAALTGADPATIVAWPAAALAAHLADLWARQSR
jgi:hypothetical protein